MIINRLISLAQYGPGIGNSLFETCPVIQALSKYPSFKPFHNHPIDINQPVCTMLSDCLSCLIVLAPIIRDSDLQATVKITKKLSLNR